MAKYLDKSKEKWDELVDQWHSDSSLTCSLQEYLELDDIEYLKFAHGIDDPDISDTEVLEKSARITRDEDRRRPSERYLGRKLYQIP